MWSSLADNPFAPTSSSSSSSAGSAPLPQPTVAVQTFKFNFMPSEEETNAEMANTDEDATTAATSSSVVLNRPAVRHEFSDSASRTPNVDEVEVITLHPASTFTVQPIEAANAVASVPAAGTAASGAALLKFYKRSSTATGLSAHSALNQVLSDSDLKPQVYEGGFKVWECAIDIILYMQSQLSLGASGLFPRGLSGARVAELGCGHAFPALYALAQGASHVAMQDYNAEVVVSATIDNTRMNLAQPVLTRTDDVASASDSTMDDSSIASRSSRSVLTLPAIPAGVASRCSFFSGDWSDPQLLAMMGPASYDLILTSDTLYSTAYFTSLFDMMVRLLSPGGIALIAAKRYYFGIGGSTLEFCELVKQRGRGEWTCESTAVFEDGKSNIREILILKRK